MVQNLLGPVCPVPLTVRGSTAEHLYLPARVRIATIALYRFSRRVGGNGFNTCEWSVDHESIYTLPRSGRKRQRLHTAQGKTSTHTRRMVDAGGRRGLLRRGGVSIWQHARAGGVDRRISRSLRNARRAGGGQERYANDTCPQEGIPRYRYHIDQRGDHGGRLRDDQRA